MTQAQWVESQLIKAGYHPYEVIEPTAYEEGSVSITPDIHVQIPRTEDYCSLVKITTDGEAEYSAPMPMSQLIEELKAEVPTV